MGDPDYFSSSGCCRGQFCCCCFQPTLGACSVSLDEGVEINPGEQNSFSEPCWWQFSCLHGSVNSPTRDSAEIILRLLDVEQTAGGSCRCATVVAHQDRHSLKDPIIGHSESLQHVLQCGSINHGFSAFIFVHHHLLPCLAMSLSGGRSTRLFRSLCRHASQIFSFPTK